MTELISTSPRPASKRSTKPRSRSRTLAVPDGRMTAAKRATEIQTALEQHLSLNGGFELTVAERQLTRRAATLGAVVEFLEAKVLAGDAGARGEYLKVVAEQRRALAAIGVAEEVP